MASPQQKTQCDIWLTENESITTVQHNFPRMYDGNAPLDKTQNHSSVATSETIGGSNSIKLFFSEDM